MTAAVLLQKQQQLLQQHFSVCVCMTQQGPTINACTSALDACTGDNTHPGAVSYGIHTEAATATAAACRVCP
jgi:hypothetical protein